MRVKIQEIICRSIEKLNGTLEHTLPIEQGDVCPLFGEGTMLDSISLVTLIVSVEQDVEDTFNVPIILADEKAMSIRNSPFLSVGKLTDYTLGLVKEYKNG